MPASNGRLACPLWEPALCARLVALNARRAAEERSGTVRWLRPEFQNPQATKTLLNQELLPHIPRGLELDLTTKTAAPVAPTSTQAWPAALPEQVRAVALVLVQAGGALPIGSIEACFKGRGTWKKSLPRILETLETLETLEALGRARREGDGWRA